MEGTAVILLDTHVLIWLAADPRQLSKPATAAIRRALQRDSLAIAAISLWELAWLAKAGRIDFDGTVAAFLARITERLTVLPLTAEVAALAPELPASYPKDPADRLIGATALSTGTPLVTKDEDIRRSGAVKTVW